jgi:leader peptidase (prepilin peptidase)/N-methyltransferase
MSNGRVRTMIAPIIARPWSYADVGVASAAVAGVAASLVAAPDAVGALGAALALVALAIAVIDARHFIIPDELNAAGLALALVNAMVQEPQAALAAVVAALARGAVLALLFWGVRVGYRWLRGRDGIGLGDVKLAGVAGAWLDALTIPVAIEIAALSALAAYVVRRQIGGRALSPQSRMPFGLFLASAIWLGWLLETTVIMPL